MNTRINKHPLRRKNRGAALLEILIYLLIFIGVIGVIGIPMYQKAKLQGDIASAAGAIRSAEQAVGLLMAQPGFNGSIPITEGTGIPITGTMAAATNTTIGNATTLEIALLGAKVLKAPISMTLGADTVTTGTVPVLWNTSTQTFYTTGDAAPNYNFSAARTLECKLSTPATAPSSAAGGNFRIDGTNNLDANVHVVYWRVPKVSGEAAYQLARSMYKGVVAAQGAAQDAGPITYGAVDSLGETVVFMYVLHY